MEKKKGSPLAVTCPGCSRKYTRNSSDFMHGKEVCCPYCGTCFKTGGNLAEEVEKSMKCYRYHY